MQYLLGTCERRWKGFCYDVDLLQIVRLVPARVGIGRRGEEADGNYEEKIENVL